MSCGSCGSTKEAGATGGCGGGCATGGCNRLNTYDWLSTQEIADPNHYPIVEVSFKNGSRKEFFRIHDAVRANTGDMVVVDTGGGFDIGKISLSGELVRMQMRKKNAYENRVSQEVLRRANDRDLERLQDVRKLERDTMIQARAMSHSLKLDMKVGDVEYQGDGRKATFYFTADGRIDFRELIKGYAKEFRVKIEMRQIGSRQESARLGGIGSCGRELCCSTWLSDFKSVSTTAARYQNLAINQSKLSGQCGRLKCCLNYELDSYMDALKHFPMDVDVLMAREGRYSHMKSDVFKGLMYYYHEPEKGKSLIIALDINQVREIQQLNKKGERPENLKSWQKLYSNVEPEAEYEDVTGAIELPAEVRKNKNNRNKSRSNANPGERNPQQRTQQNQGAKQNPQGGRQNPQGGQQKQQNAQGAPQQQPRKANPNEKQNPNQPSNKPPQGNQRPAQRNNPNRRPNPNQNPNNQQRPPKSPESNAGNTTPDNDKPQP
ncbi:MAG: regulatory iron-sulfur-containing complex subunit RicT [Saprospiraceae bacterium]